MRLLLALTFLCVTPLVAVGCDVEAGLVYEVTEQDARNAVNEFYADVQSQNWSDIRSRLSGDVFSEAEKEKMISDFEALYAAIGRPISFTIDEIRSSKQDVGGKQRDAFGVSVTAQYDGGQVPENVSMFVNDQGRLEIAGYKADPGELLAKKQESSD